ncbi:Glycine cleavage system H protein [Caenorhabditis elegans]|uniref:Glycine cleavage system H protein n=1 Tax=Caenorhabditis elegans TaxID=6239 RepID=O62122_CAEEL|nr:Glycine cleavage system H protein [Caenorhabditis elegans]CAB05472.1 Glycine cleavage system H protein [Caenorhabditis elegans]|eukprot:NP_510414.1 Glycine cleavage system H protein [Caenorhabditis elegans]
MSFLSRFIPTVTARTAIRFASNGRLYTKKHEWIVVNQSVGTVGITDFATEQLGDVVFIELPEAGVEIEKGDSTGAVESVKAASDIYAPVSGKILEKNTKLEDEPGIINKSPLEKGWLYRLEITSNEQLNELLTEEQYNKFKSEEEAEH